MLTVPTGLMRPFHARTLLGTAALAFLLGGCTPTITQHGYVPNEDRIASIRTALDDRESIRAKLGSPSTLTAFGDETWLYVSRRVEEFAFYSPKVLEQQVVSINFNDRGFVQEVRRLSLEDGRLIDPVTRETPTLGRELGVFEQLFGNLGRFNSGQPSGRPTPRPSPRR